jgi:hypothetical protein
MINSRLFYLQLHPDDPLRPRRPLQAHPARRPYQVPNDPRVARNIGRR